MAEAVFQRWQIPRASADAAGGLQGYLMVFVESLCEVVKAHPGLPPYLLRRTVATAPMLEKIASHQAHVAEVFGLPMDKARWLLATIAFYCIAGADTIYAIADDEEGQVITEFKQGMQALVIGSLRCWMRTAICSVGRACGPTGGHIWDLSMWPGVPGQPRLRVLPSPSGALMDATLRASWSQRMLAWLKEAAPLLMLLGLFFVARDTLANHYVVPSGSMQPALQPGDRVVVDMRAYGLRLPFSGLKLMGATVPQRGEVVVFASPADGVRMIKRVVAVAGDRVRLQDGRLSVNGRPSR